MGFLKLPTLPVFLVNSCFLVLGFFLKNGRKVYLTCPYFREDREFEKVVKEQVGTIFPSANGLDNVEVLKGLLMLVLSPIGKKWKFQSLSASKLHLFS